MTAHRDMVTEQYGGADGKDTTFAYVDLESAHFG